MFLPENRLRCFHRRDTSVKVQPTSTHHRGSELPTQLLPPGWERRQPYVGGRNPGEETQKKHECSPLTGGWWWEERGEDHVSMETSVMETSAQARWRSGVRIFLK